MDRSFAQGSRGFFVRGDRTFIPVLQSRIIAVFAIAGFVALLGDVRDVAAVATIGNRTIRRFDPLDEQFDVSDREKTNLTHLSFGFRGRHLMLALRCGRRVSLASCGWRGLVFGE